MTAESIEAALAARYDGPRPFAAAAPGDCGRSRREQILNRKRWAWREVRRLGHLMVSARRAFRATESRRDHHDWAQARGSLRHALSSWACFRDWLRELDDGASPDGAIQSWSATQR